ncbi:MAG TPA: HEAT repeat domain-containing protein [Planctomycetota bacterium]|nr:HEAT repeat domain-containing protein [Planctomycetota bacterium]
MTAEAPGSEAIELHFCRRCGISIPQTDIETHRARAVPGGFLCDACALDSPLLAPRPAAPVSAPAQASGSRVLVLVALLYVVGATTFLLVRELTRQPPREPRGDLLAAGDLDPLARKIEALDEQTRAALADLKGNDERQRQDANALSLAMNALSDDAARTGRDVRSRLDDLEAVAKAVANRVQLVRDDVEAARNELRQLRGEAPVAKPPPEVLPPVEGPVQKSPEEIERERLVSEYISKLGDKKSPNNTRYNAAVSLGDLRHASAIPALIDALENDPYDLVCRAAAWSLSMYGKDAIPAIPALIRQLGGKDGTVGYMCERALGEITKAATGTAVSFGFDSNANQRARRAVQKKWEDWWEENKGKLLP